MSKYILSIVFILLGVWGKVIISKYVSHSAMTSQEELIGGIKFKHIKKSVNGKKEEQFLIDGIVVQKYEFEKRIEEAHLADIRKKRYHTECQKQHYIEFTDQVQTAILEKLAKNMLLDISQRIDKLYNDILKPYVIFHDSSIKSSYQLAEMKHYVQQQLRDLQELIDDSDTQSLQEICDKIENWPEYLDICFKDSVQNAIKQSDDTSILKELLAFVSE